jgi:hypothetical protein
MTPSFRGSVRGVQSSLSFFGNSENLSPPVRNARNLSSNAVSPAVLYDFVISAEA